MTQEQILEGNKLIAEFMGFEMVDDANVNFKKKYWHIDHGVYNEINNKVACYYGWNKWQIADTLKFTYSWDWIMPVVEKIEKHGCVVEIWFGLAIGCRIKKISGHQVVMEGNVSIETVWLAVIEFIKWYNNQNIT